MADRGAYEFLSTVVDSPVLNVTGGEYRPPLLIEISQVSGADIYYTLDGSEPTSGSTLYTEPFYIDGTILMSIALLSGTYSSITSASFSATPANFILSGGDWVRDDDKFETSAVNYESKLSLQDVLQQYITSISGNVNTILTSAHGSGQWDAVTVVGEVVLSANQPNYPAALQSTLLAAVASITGNQAIIITKEDNISATQVTIISKEDSISASISALGSPMQAGTKVVLSASQPDYPAALQSTLLVAVSSITGNQAIIITKEDNISATQVTIISKEDSISASVAALGTPMQSGTEVVLSASQPSYAPSKAGDAMTLIPSLLSGSAVKSWTVSSDNIDFTPEQVDTLNSIDVSASNLPVVLSATQPYYAPSKVGDEMSLNALALSAVQDGLLKHADTLDGETIDYILQAVMAMVNNNFTLSGNTMTLYKRDGVTPFSVMTKTTTQRTRIS